MTPSQYRALRTGGVLIAALAVWLAADELPWPARALTAALLTVLPVLMLAQARAAQTLTDALPRVPIYLTSAAGVWLLAAVAVGTARVSGFGAALLGLRILPLAELLAWTLAATAAGLLVLGLARLLGIPESPLLVDMLPRSRAERLTFVSLAVSAGIGEELIFRSFLVPALTAATGATWAGASIAALSFGILHSYQGLLGVARAALLGLVLTVPFLYADSVLPSMIAHAALDLLAGLWLARWLLQR